MKKTLLKVFLLSIIVLLLLVVIMYVCLYFYGLSLSRQIKIVDSSETDEPEVTAAHFDLPTDISDLRITAAPSSIDTSLESEDSLAVGFIEPFQNLKMMQILYGYYSDGQWVDYPSENYALREIWNIKPKRGWEAGDQSHIVKIGPYLLICIATKDNPLMEDRISDTLNSEVLYPLGKYDTYYYYTDSNGKDHYYMDTHVSGYGYIAVNPAATENSKDSRANLVCEFYRRYYLILDYETIPEDYVLTFTRTNSITASEKQETLTYNDIVSLLEE